MEEVSNELGNALAHSFNKRGMDWEKAKVLAAVCLSFASPPLNAGTLLNQGILPK